MRRGRSRPCRASGSATTSGWAASPAHLVPKPRRLPNVRRALTADELEEINLVARTSGNDTILDALLLRLHTETACRRGGALGLRVMDLDVDRGLVRLTEKGGTLRWQPITLDLATRLGEHAQARGAHVPADGLLCFRHGAGSPTAATTSSGTGSANGSPGSPPKACPPTGSATPPSPGSSGISGTGIARAYAGHTDSTGAATTTYIKADLQAVATALAAMTGQRHPSLPPKAPLISTEAPRFDCRSRSFGRPRRQHNRGCPGQRAPDPNLADWTSGQTMPTPGRCLSKPQRDRLRPLPCPGQGRTGRFVEIR